MADIAQIGFRAETGDLVNARNELRALVPAATQVEKAAVGVENAMQQAAAGTDRLSVASARLKQAQASAAVANAKASDTATKADIQTAQAAKRKADAVLAAARADAIAEKNAMAAAAAARQEATAFDQAAAARKRYSGAVPLVPRSGGGGVTPWGDTPNMPGGGANDNAVGAMRANVGNIAAQFQDIGVTAAMGMNPLMIALQQGTQLSAVFAASGESLGKTLVTAFRSVISPMSLLTIGIVALVAAGLQMIDWVWLAKTGLDALADVLPTIAPYAIAAGAALAIAFAPSIAAGVWAIASAITMGLMNAIIGIVATIGAVPILLASVVAGFFIFRDEITQILGVDIVAAAKTGVNYIIGAFVGAYHDIEFLWKQFPNIIGAAVIGAANLAIKAANGIIQAGVDGINTLISAVNSVLSIGGIGEKLGFGGIGEISFSGAPELANKYADDLASAVGDRNAQLQADLTADYLGAIGGAIGDATAAVSSKLKGFSAGLGGDADAKKKRRGGGKTESERFEDIVSGAERSIAALQAEKDAIGLTAEAAARLKHETDLLNQAKQKNINLSPEQEAKLRSLAGEMAHLEVETKKAQEALDFSKGLFKDFVSELRNGLENGEGFWQSFANAAMGALDTIIDKLLNDVIDAIFQVNDAAGGGGGGGLGGILSGILGIFGGGGGLGGLTWETWAKGGAFANGISAYSNDVVNKPTMFAFASGAGIMGEAGPEAIMPLTRGPDGSLGVQMYNDGGRSSGGGSDMIDVAVTVGWSRSADGNLKPFVEDIAQTRANAAVQQYDQDALPYRVNEIAEDRRVR